MQRRSLARLSALSAVITLAAFKSAAAGPEVPEAKGHDARFDHVLLISVDGLHQVDVENYVRAHPSSTFARLEEHGISYSNARTAKPSDSFPGLLALVTGASPRTSGVSYDDSYDRALSPVGDLQCQTIGAATMYAENIDISFDAVALGGSTRLDAGGGIDPNLLPRDAKRGCTPVFPHDFLRVNTIFNVAAAHGLHTAWSDKHPAYEIVRGRANTGAEDLYTPEINSPPHDLACTASEGPGGDVDDNCPVIDINSQWTSNVTFTAAYDGLKVQAVLNEIKGFDHTGNVKTPVPAIFGMNFQAVSVGQKLTADGYLDAAGSPSAGLAQALDFVDASLGKFVSTLEQEGLHDKTLIIVGAKHGQSPIDVTKLHVKTGSKNPKAIADVTDVTDVLDPVVAVAHATEDDISLLWLGDSNQATTAVAALAANSKAIRAQTIFSGGLLRLIFGDPRKDPRTPDLIVQPIPGTIYTKSAAKIAEHGGFAADDTHTALIVSNPRLRAASVDEIVTNRQVAPTILRALGLPIDALDGVRLEGTRVLPGFER